MRRKVLIIEDDLDLLDLLSFNLKKAGFAVGTASDGIEGLKKARSLVPDLVLVDIMLPEMDGFSICETLRKNSGQASPRIVMMTALGTQFAKLSSIESGANDFIGKPFTFKALMERISALLPETPAACDSRDRLN